MESGQQLGSCFGLLDSGFLQNYKKNKLSAIPYIISTVRVGFLNIPPDNVFI